MKEQKNKDLEANIEHGDSPLFSAEKNPALLRGISSSNSSESDNTLTFVVEKNNSENKPKSKFIPKRFFVNILVVIALAVFAGVQGGLFYLDTFVKSFAPPTVAEDTIRDDTLAIVSMSSGKTPSDMSAIDAAIVADYLLTQATCVQKTTVGDIVAMGVTQKMAAVKKRVGDLVYSEKLSTGLLSVGNASYHTLGSDLFEFYSGSNVTLSGATWPSSPSYTWDYATYIDHFRSKPEYFINYIISSKTVQASSITMIDGGKYKVSLDLDAVYSVLNYVYEIRETSGSSKFPNFKSVHMDIVMDSEFRIHTIDIDETYDVAVVQLGGGYVETHAVIHEEFIYEGVTING